MTSALLVLLAVAALSASSALLVARLGLTGFADALAATAAACGLLAFGLATGYTVHRARRLGKRIR